MKKLSMKASIFVGLFVGFIVFIISLLSNILLPNISNFIMPIILGLTALFGAILGNKMFPKEK